MDACAGSWPLPMHASPGRSRQDAMGILESCRAAVAAAFLPLSAQLQEKKVSLGGRSASPNFLDEARVKNCGGRGSGVGGRGRMVGGRDVRN